MWVSYAIAIVCMLLLITFAWGKWQDASGEYLAYLVKTKDAAFKASWDTASCEAQIHCIRLVGAKAVKELLCKSSSR